MYSRRVFKVQGHCFHYSVVDGDVSVLRGLPGALRLLLQYRKGRLEAHALVYQMAEPQCQQVAYPQSEVDAYDEQHVVPVSSSGREPSRYTIYVVQALDRSGGVFASYPIARVFDRRSYQSIGQCPGRSRKTTRCYYCIALPIVADVYDVRYFRFLLWIKIKLPHVYNIPHITLLVNTFNHNISSLWPFMFFVVFCDRSIAFSSSFKLKLSLFNQKKQK